jgi:DNA-binding NarL/FixJ family response regulator
MSKIKIAIVDDHMLLRDGIHALLRDVADFEIVMLLSSGEEAVNLPGSVHVDLFLMDIMMKGMNGIEATRWIKSAQPACKVILISSEISNDYVSLGIKSGIDGYLPKDVDKSELVSAIRKVMAGERYFNNAVTSMVLNEMYHSGDAKTTKKKVSELTKRENEILAQIASGKSLKEIADELFISVKTVETHKLNIQEKLGLANTAQLVRYALEKKLI